ncbi:MULTISPECIES: ABC transporter ATP-binding protein [Piscirickettsiaceae]|jgi:iron(III) transport system ATP-binding protein|uniref:ABC transporter ATP-binding protein n=1 Tax=Hydrogenovibrio thermophilus TaxID=265883 RepID=A0A410H1T9_9GAMM|nr:MULTISPECIES: ABC transporter ATP-binding protein [Piscirickettsiaceae]AZR82577.1 ABC transporter [Thiomicrospira sp. S5]QAB14861.1 ABC transporter ATP-binding protein [Hydrogenovibrio thermophilus]
MVELDKVCINLGQQALFKEFTLSFAAGEIIGLLGPSGCGKTTLLRSIAGFTPIQSGVITVNDRCLACDGQSLPPEKRNISMVFQDHALFPHLTVAENIAFGLRGQSKTEQRRRVDELLTMIHLNDLANRYPHEISGGQQQRVALARALAPKPALVLLDEPFSNLDPALRHRLAEETRQWLKQENTPALLVTHDETDAQTLCDHYGTLTASKIQFANPTAA